jgi:hypothetical protein
MIRTRLKSPSTAKCYEFSEWVTDTSRDKLAGENEASRLLQIAARRAYTPADLPARKRVDSILAGQVFEADDNCDSLARAGVLGDTVWPEFKKWK